MEFWYFIIQNEKSVRVSYETYCAYEGEKYATPCYPGLRFFIDYLKTLR